MSKKYTAKQYEQIIHSVLCGALEHIEAIKKEITKIGPVTDESDPNLIARAKVMHLTLTCINDIIHPAHKLLYKLFSETDNVSYFDTLVKNHKLAMERNLLPACYCPDCDPLKEKAKAKFEEMKEYKATLEDTSNGKPEEITV